MGGWQISDLIAAVRRRAWILALTVIILAPAALAVAWVLPAKFIATARILIEAQQIPGQLAPSVITTTPAQRLDRIRQRLLTRERLGGMIADLDLYPDEPDVTLASKIDRVRDNTAFMPLLNPDGSGSLTGIEISFTAGTATASAAMANALAEAVLAENIDNRTGRATQTRAYFASEVGRLERALKGIEDDINAFQRDNECCLPATLGFRQKQLTDLQARVSQRQQTVLSLEEQRLTLQQSLDTGTAFAPVQQNLSPLERTLMGLRQQLVESQAVKSDSHPEIQSLKARISAIERALGAQNPSNDGKTQAEILNERKQQQIQSQIAKIDRQITLEADQDGKDKALEETLKASLARTPEVSIALNGFLREQTRLQNQYDTASENLNLADRGKALEINRQAERFELVEPAQIPEAPSAPKRKIIAGGGVFAAVLLGLGLMAVVELLNQSIRTAHGMEHKVGLSPIVSIPYVTTWREQALRRLRWWGVLLVMLVALPATLWLVDTHYIPVLPIVERLSERVGLDGIVASMEAMLGL